tara:strand:+ start:235 stop:405 length:171 start_codon:yes stop_codon:yes gene_type:complete
VEVVGALPILELVLVNLVVQAVVLLTLDPQDQMLEEQQIEILQTILPQLKDMVVEQ